MEHSPCTSLETDECHVLPEDDEQPNIKKVKLSSPGEETTTINEPQVPLTKMSLWFDGASKGNPGKSGAGWVIRGPNDEPIAYGWKYIGDVETNNVAEYAALEQGLVYIDTVFTSNKPETLMIYGDSKLVVGQVSGTMKVKAPHLVPVCERVRSLLVERFYTRKCNVTLKHIPREENTEADTLSNAAIKIRTTAEFDATLVPISFHAGPTPERFVKRNPQTQ